MNREEGVQTVESSRNSQAGAGWVCTKVGKFRSLIPARSKPFSWLNPIPLWLSRNQVLGDLLGDPTNNERRKWMEIQREAYKLKRDLIVDHKALGKEFSFLVVGDTGVDLPLVDGQTRVSDVNANERSPHDAGSNTTLPARVQTRSRPPCPLLSKQER